MINFDTISRLQGWNPSAQVELIRRFIQQENLEIPLADFAMKAALNENLETLWDNDNIQFTRLLAEIKAVGLTPEQLSRLTVSMDLLEKDIHELFQRAESGWETSKEEMFGED